MIKDGKYSCSLKHISMKPCNHGTVILALLGQLTFYHKLYKLSASCNYVQPMYAAMQMQNLAGIEDHLKVI